ncbi:hypothetical protein ACN27F_13845 [Solwaraspora sp. WMMB335]|uniref:hypothetical protein n=1 Tax=Solwaraspora sp. WMMB335 TaxID=3404118 RepID=UPI003B94AFE3
MTNDDGRAGDAGDTGDEYWQRPSPQATGDEFGAGHGHGHRHGTGRRDAGQDHAAAGADPASGYCGPPVGTPPPPGWRPPLVVNPAPPRSLPAQDAAALDEAERGARTVTYGVGMIVGAVMIVLVCLLCSRLLF